MDQPLMLVIKQTYKVWAHYMKTLAAEAGIPDSYRMLLTFLLRHPGASQKELAAHCNITTSSISQTVKEMQLTGFLKKESDHEDQRYFKLYLTEKGTACAQALRDKIHLADKKITALLSPEREKEIIAMMEQLSDIITKELPTC
ncbi:MAG: MarR family winged helix-turn-helix transcriptional regulator [Clostridia bacterium]